MHVLETALRWGMGFFLVSAYSLCLCGCYCRWADPAPPIEYTRVRYVQQAGDDYTSRLRRHDLRAVLTNSPSEAILHHLRNEVLSALPWEEPTHGFAMEMQDRILIARLPERAHEVVAQYLAGESAALGPMPPLPWPPSGAPMAPRVFEPEK